MTFTEFSGILAGGISLTAFFFYYASILQGDTKPNRATWLILSVVGFIIFFSYYSVNEAWLPTAWVPLSFAIGPAIAFVLSLFYGEGGWSKFDQHCLFIAGLSLLAWYFTGSAMVALLINIFVDFLGMLPTVRKSYERPKSEAYFPWFLTFIAGSFDLLAVEAWTFEIALHPVYMFFINGIVFLLLFFPQRRSRARRRVTSASRA